MNYNQYPVTEKKLGALYTKESTTFNVWAPTQNQLSIALYEDSRQLHRTLHTMKKASDGVFSTTIKGDLHGKFYTIIVDSHLEVTDPYCLSANANGIRSAIVDLARTNPEGWDTHKRPIGANGCDAVLYEMHVRDFTGHRSSGAAIKGKFLSLSENGTNYNGYVTGLDHLVSLGVTHVHLLPIYDFLTVDETDDSDENYNWGYDPEHFNAPEGSYSTDANDPLLRILELKSAIKALHEHGFKVVLDVVYNHTYRTFDSNFNALVPKYYHRTTEAGEFSNGSGCGNEFASDHPMGRKFIVDSLCYWAKEYKVDGFRFDLMALIDVDTVALFMAALKNIDPEILIYGEPWMGGLSTLPENKRVYKGVQCGKGFALFNDDFRDAIKGDNDGTDKGFIHGNKLCIHDTKVGITGSIPYSETLIGFASTPSESINYFNSHDNLILFDKLKKTSPDANLETLIRQSKLAFGVLFTAQGVPFFHAGNEFLRDKKGHHNTYNASMSINGINWENKEKYYEFYNYVVDLIRLRKEYACLRMDDVEQIKSRLNFYEDDATIDRGAIVYTIHQTEGSAFDCLMVAHNPSGEALMLSINKLVKHMCCDPKVDPKTLHHKVAVKHIFDENGLFTTPVDIDPSHHHLVKIDPISTNVFTFKKLK